MTAQELEYLVNKLKQGCPLTPQQLALLLDELYKVKESTKVLKKLIKYSKKLEKTKSKENK